MAHSLIAKWRLRQVLVMALAAAVLPAMQPVGLPDVAAVRTISDPQLLLPLAIDLCPIGHEYKAVSTTLAALTPLVLTERFVLAASPHCSCFAPAPGVGHLLWIERYGVGHTAHNLAGTPRSPPTFELIAS